MFGDGDECVEGVDEANRAARSKGPVISRNSGSGGDHRYGYTQIPQPSPQHPQQQQQQQQPSQSSPQPSQQPRFFGNRDGGSNIGVGVGVGVGGSGGGCSHKWGPPTIALYTYGSPR